MTQGGQDPKISDPMAPCSVKMLNELHTILKGVHGLVSYTFHIPGLYPWWLGIAESEYPLGKNGKEPSNTPSLGCTCTSGCCRPFPSFPSLPQMRGFLTFAPSGVQNDTSPYHFKHFKLGLELMIINWLVTPFHHQTPL